MHIIDYGLAKSVGYRHARTPRPKNMPWYCDCSFNGAPMKVECDLPGLGIVLEDLFRHRLDVPLHILHLVARCTSLNHTQRPKLHLLV